MPLSRQPLAGAVRIELDRAWVPHYEATAVIETIGPLPVDGQVDLINRLIVARLSGASDEFLLAATVQNLKKLVRFLAHGPPTTAACTP